MNTSRKGNAAENFIGKDLVAKGFIVGSRRHLKGPGDWLAVHPDGRIWLVEAKHCKNLWENFRRDDRQAMRECLLPPHAERWVANRRGQSIEYVPEADWP